ncbi:MAG: zf-HC2 domain-containing protein [Armatimonadota bacterium]
MGDNQVPLEFNQCQEAVKRLNEYLSRELEEPEVDLVQRHLTQCKGCFDKFRFEETLLRTIREKAEQVTAPRDLRSRILSLFDRSGDD